MSNFLFDRGRDAVDRPPVLKNGGTPDAAWAARYDRFFGDVYSPNRVGPVGSAAEVAGQTVVPSDDNFARFFRHCT